MLNIICDLFELYNYEKIDLEQGFLFSHPNDSEKKDFWIVIEEDDLSSVVLRQSDILNDCKIKYESNKNLFSEWFNLLLNTPKIDIDTKINEGTFYFFETEILEITQFIDRKIEQEKTKIQILNYKSYESTIKEIETPEIDYSNTPPLERMIILEKLGIIKYIQSIQKDSKNEKETARILSSFTGINTGTVAKNLGVMLGHKKNDSDKNSPYNNPKNQQLADNKLINFNIDLTKIIK